MKRNGFTLLELLMTIAILLIIAVMAAPSFSNLLQQTQTKSVQDEWFNFLTLGRSTAILKQQILTACPLIENKCDNNLIADWSLFTDPNKNKILDAGEYVIRVLQVDSAHKIAFYPIDRLYFRFSDSRGGDPAGFMRGMTVCTKGVADKTAFHLRVNILGRIATTQKRDAAGVPLRMEHKVLKPVVCER